MIRAFKKITPQIANCVFIAETAVIIGDVLIGEGSSIWYGVVIRGDVNYIRIGKNTNIQDLSVLHVTGQKSADRPGQPLIIGNNVTVGHKALLHGCTIEDDAFIGMNATVMDRVIVGKGAMVAAGSLVTEGTIIPPETLWVGAPAKMKRNLTKEELARGEQLALSYAALKDLYIVDL